MMTEKPERPQDAVDTTPDLAELRSLELHYFRVPRERWELMLARLHQMGADAVSTVVPWSWHEPRDNAFDLTGVLHPARDLVGFVETCGAIGLRVVLRVGPYVDGAGLLGGGVPGWLTREHPEMLALGPDSQPRRNPIPGEVFPSAGHPSYLNYVERWYRELAGALSGRQWPDGPIVALQVGRPAPTDSEPKVGGIPNAWDYNPHVVKAQWPVWLRQQYDGIDALNRAWGADYRSFGDVAFPDGPPAPASSPRFADAERFVAHAATRATESYARMVRRAGWTLPIVTSSEKLAATRPVTLAHAAQVDPEPPELGAGTHWAMDAPLRGDGHAQRRFWVVKAALLAMEQGVKRVEGGVLVTGPDNRRVRLPRPAGDYGLYRLLLDGRLLDAPGRARGDTLYVDYMAADDAGETDMVLLLDDRSAPLTGFTAEYLARTLAGLAQAVRRAGTMCQALSEALASADEALPAGEDLQVAERSLAEARLAAQRAAASLGRLERLASDIRGETLPASPSLAPLVAFTPQELERLAYVRDACAGATPALAEAAGKLATIDRGSLTVDAYRAAWEGVQATARAVEASLAVALRFLRADLAAGVLSPAAWSVHGWLAPILRGLDAGLLRVGD